jgi:hypothetical protein
MSAKSSESEGTLTNFVDVAKTGVRWFWVSKATLMRKCKYISIVAEQSNRIPPGQAMEQ